MEPDLKKLPLRDLRIDTSYQREFVPRRAKKIKANFDPVLAGVLEVNLRDDGTYSVVDGQHRLDAMIGLGMQEWWCKINKLSHAQEANTFVNLQTQRAQITNMDRHKALLVARDETATDIQTILDMFNLVLISPNSRPTNAMRAIKSVRDLYQIYAAGGKQHLIQVIGLMSRAWPDERPHEVLQGRLMKGVSRVLRAYPDIDVSNLVTKLSGVAPVKILRDAAAYSTTGSADLGTSVSLQIVQVYNSGKRSGRLDPTVAAKRLVTKGKLG